MVALDSVASADRFELFRSTVNDLFCPMLIEPRGPSDRGFTGRVAAMHLGQVGLACVSTRAIVVRRRRQDIQRMSEAPYLVKFQARGESMWQQRGRTVHLKQGDFVLCSTAEPYSLTFVDSYEMPVLALSAPHIHRLTPDPDQFLGVRFSADDADCSILSSFVLQVVKKLGELTEPMIARVETNVLDLLAGVLSARADPTAASPAQLRTRILAYISDHLQDRRLSPVWIAQVFRISVRTLHGLFETEPATVERLIRKLRVAACAKALRESSDRSQSMTDIAALWGFYDLSHMSRAFRAELGLSPAAVRHEGYLPE
jgi:AraC-like DNA-binding protein